MVGDNDKEIETELREEIPAVRMILNKENNKTISDNTEDSNENVKKEKLFQEWSQIMEIRLKNEDERHNKEMMEMVEKLDKKYAKCLEITKEKVFVEQEAMFEQLRIDLQAKNSSILEKTEAKFIAKVDTLLDIIAQKDVAINRLNEQIGEVQRSIEVTDQRVRIHDEKIQNLDYHADSAFKELNYLVDKSADLEDRSKRNNLIFNGIQEEVDRESNEDCEKKLRNLIVNQDMLNGKSLVQFDRVHRLGSKKNGATRSRPIVCRLTFFKDKQTILKNGPKLKGTNISMSEQYSEQTVDLHKKLYTACKAAKSVENSPIERYYVNYKYASVVLKSGERRNFNLEKIEGNVKWYEFGKNFQNGRRI